MFKILFVTLFLSTVGLSLCAGDRRCPEVRHYSFKPSSMRMLKGEEGQLVLLISPPLEDNKQFRIAVSTRRQNELRGISLKLHPPKLAHDGRHYQFTVRPTDGKIDEDVQRYIIDFRAEDLGDAHISLYDQYIEIQCTISYNLKSLAGADIEVQAGGATQDYN